MDRLIAPVPTNEAPVDAHDVPRLASQLPIQAFAITMMPIPSVMWNRR